MKLIRARILLTQVSPPIEDGAVVIEGEHVVAVGRYRDLASFPVQEQVDLEEHILLPGLINAHCHLDYTGMRGRIPPEKIFSRWLQSIIALKKNQTRKDYLAAIGEGQKELLRSGTTTVFNIGAVLDIMEDLPTPLLRTWWFYELIDVGACIDVEAFVLWLLKFSQNRPDWRGGFGLSPHAPYTASRELYQNIKFYAKKYKIPITTHVSEAYEELEMFRDGNGFLFNLVKSMGRPMGDCKTKSSAAILLGEDLLPQGSILVHMNFLEEADWQILQRVSSHFTVVHCPKTHTYFGREEFPWKRFRQCGISVCLGTDSLASNDSLNLFEEMRLFLRLQRGTTEQEVLDMVTLHPARAIGLATRLGKIAIGTWADLIAIPYLGGVEETVSAVVSYSQTIDWVMVGGKMHVHH